MRKPMMALAGIAALALSTAGVAQATPGVPAAHTGAVGALTQTTAVLHGAVDPHGVDTEFSFNYGPTTSLGDTTTPISVGAGRKPVPVKQEIGALTPGTTYYYEITATNGVSTATGKEGTFTTKGAAPSTVATGPAVDLGKTTATATGSIIPNGATTSWYVQYGKTTAYGANTTPQALAAGTTAIPVTSVLSGLAPATLFHYRIVAVHPDGFTSVGADQTFFTLPDNPPPPDMTTKITPKTDKTTPFTFTASGKLNGGTFIPAASRCSGTVGIRFFNGKHQLGYAVANVGSDCTFTSRVSFKKLDGNGPVKLRVSVFYRGNDYLDKASKIDHPIAGESHQHKGKQKK